MTRMMGATLGLAARRLAAFLALAALAGCGTSTVDGVRVEWPPFKDGAALVLPSDPAQCPDLAGRYRAAGELRDGKAMSGAADLQRFLADMLGLPGLRDTAERAWRPTAAASVTLVSVAGGWRVEADDGLGGGSADLLRQRDGAADPDAPGENVPGIQRFSGCTQGRFWISARRDWHQYESMGMYRTMALLRPLAGGLLVTVQRESQSIGLLPWYSSDEVRAQYWFAPR